MTGRESTEPLDPAQIMAVHGGGKFLPQADSYVCNNATCGQLWPCLPYRLAEALAAERARVQRVEALAEAWLAYNPEDQWAMRLAAALAGDTEGAAQ